VAADTWRAGLYINTTEETNMIAWLLYSVLLALNFLDYATTHALLANFRLTEEYGMAPPWKGTRFGKWCVRWGFVKPPEHRKIEWYEHEINPLMQKYLKKTDLLGLAALKGLALGLIASMVAINPISSTVAGWGLMLLLIDLYVFVVINNLGMMRRCRLAPFAK
jgi:hypothetical protein